MPRSSVPPQLQRQVLYTRVAGWVVVGGCIVASFFLGAKYPLLNPPLAVVCLLVGKLIGVPMDAVMRYLLASQPEKALAAVADALREMPAEHAESVANELLASLPPAAAQRVGVVLLNTSSAPPAPATPPST